MASLEDLGYKSISDMSTDEAIELLKQVRLERKITKKTTKSKPATAKKRVAKVTKAVDATLAAELLKILGGNK